MSRIAILGQSLWPDDGVGHDMLETASALLVAGHEVALFACHCDRDNRRIADARGLARFLRGDRSAVLFYFHSIGWVEAVEHVARARCCRVVRYHNVTPSRYFAPYSADVAGNCREGRRQVRRLARAGCDLYLSASTYSQRDLVRLGAPAERCRVVPPFHRVDRLNSLAPDPEVLRECGDGRTNVLFVGRFVPNKDHVALIDAFAHYHRRHDHNSRLVLVGKEDGRLKGYADQLRARVHGHGLRGLVTFAGETDDAGLKAFYLSADVFLSATRHEGFCLPLVEAMAMRVPVVARAAAAVPETVGDAGLLWPRPGPALLAEALACIGRDRGVREALAARGRRRYRDYFSREKIEARLLEALERRGRDPAGLAEQIPTLAR